MTWHFICVSKFREYFKKLKDMQLISSKTLIRVLGIVVLLAGLSTNMARAQGYFEGYSNHTGSNLSITGGLGSALLFGDLTNAESGEFSFVTNSYQANLGVSYRLTNYISIRGEATAYRLYLERNNSFFTRDGDGVQHLNLSTTGVNGSILLVHDIFSRTSIDRGQKSWNIYVLAGVGQTYFTPKDADTKENLRELLPYQNYAKVAVIFPVGSGIQFFPSSYLGIGFEWQYIRTSTDLLDDAEPITELNSAKDSFFTFGAKITYQIGGAGNGGSVSGFNYQSYLKKSKRRAKYK